MILCDVRLLDPRVAYLKKHGLPFISFGRTIDTMDYSFIDVDGAAGTALAVTHLIQLGHRRIVFLGLDPDFSFSYFRRKGYEQALIDAEIPVDAALIHEGVTQGTAEVALRTLLASPNPPTAVFATADFLGIAVVKAARDVGLAIPADLSVCVFDDSPLVQHVDPPLTAVSQPNRRLGEESARLLLERIDRPDTPPAQQLVMPALVVRQSTAAVRPSTGQAVV
jgi:LacI family transcriptional regulator